MPFAIGGDTGGSVRVPASYCGVPGMRTTHGAVPLDGAVPFAPSYDTVGWFAKDAVLFERVGRVLLADDAPAPIPRASSSPPRRSSVRCRRPVTHCSRCWRASLNPEFGGGIRERFRWVAMLTPDDVVPAMRRRTAIAARLHAPLADDSVLAIPTTPGISPRLDTPVPELEAWRNRCLGLLCIAGHAGLPQVSLPAGTMDGCPTGLSLVAAPGRDTMLLELARRLAA